MLGRLAYEMAQKPYLGHFVEYAWMKKDLSEEIFQQQTAGLFVLTLEKENNSVFY